MDVYEKRMTTTLELLTNATGDIGFATTIPSARDTIPIDDWLWDPVTWSWWEILQAVFAAIGLAGNLLVMAVLFQRRTTRKSADALIGALAAADFMTSLFMIPHREPQTVPDTLIGHLACKVLLSSVFMWVSVMASVFTLTAISVERFIAVVYPLYAKRYLTTRRTITTVIIIWVCCAIINCQSFVVTSVDPSTRNCIVRYKSMVSQKIFGICVFLLLFVIPTSIMLLSQILIARELQRQSVRFADDQRTDPSSPAYNILRAKKRVVRLLLIVVSMYIICWAPDHIAFLAFNLHLLDVSFLYSPLYHGLVVLAFFNSCVNPIIYGVNYPEFRKALRETFWESSSSIQRASLFAPDTSHTTSSRA
nr:gastrin/cholecystokinin type B receptor-like [Lytechinus pictus]